ncbi:MAG TPA: hypothetical protein VKP30_29265 [Polyangiaceae bacterium]|nr:hypothetical protein [Polyangiaceae bacterium]
MESVTNSGRVLLVDPVSASSNVLASRLRMQAMYEAKTSGRNCIRPAIAQDHLQEASRTSDDAGSIPARAAAYTTA